jgi:hypothetical protein
VVEEERRLELGQRADLSAAILVPARRSTMERAAAKPTVSGKADASGAAMLSQ